MPLGSISSLGVGSSFDLQGILDQLRAAEEIPITRMEQKKADIEVQLAEFDSVKTKFLTMKSHVLNLSLQSNFLVKGISVSNQDILTASVALGTPESMTSVEVIRLATKSVFQSDGVADADATVITADSTFAYQVGPGGETINLSVTADMTLNQLADLINNDENNPGITAFVIDDGTGTTPFRLVLTANETGEERRITIVTPLNDLTFTEVQGNGTSLNAAIKVDGITYERQQNTGIKDVLQGITLNLKDTGTTTIEVSTDTSALQADIVGLIETFNEVVQEVTTQSAYDEESGTFGPLASSALRGTISALKTLIGTQINTGGAVTSLYDLGLEINWDGSITLDEDVLVSALSDHLDAVMKLFIGEEEEGITGLADLLNDQLYNITSANGLIASEQEASNQTLSRLEAQIETTKARLDRRFDILTRQFIALDTFISQIQSQADFLTNMISSFNNSSQS